ncbi:MAG TPA: zf-HC2 domain-containing protein [Thermoanaerobaculia bacterium]|nr:zf-HC2 domain-containing protein [Thermoanaerobaculia bacterium]
MRIFSMRCREFVEYLDRYLADELPELQKREFDWHLRLCRSCRAYLKTYRETIRFTELAREDLEREVQEEVPEELVAAILASRRS